ncbi:MAG: DUF5906 domain-containing protein [Cyanobacteria bacterium J06558_2]
MKTEYQNRIVSATKNSPCPHCGKPDWCYRLGDLSVCNRDHEPAEGWYKTSKTDEDGHFFYAPVREKPLKKKQERKWTYKNLDNNDVVRVTRIDKGNGEKPIRFQEYWNGSKWEMGLKGIDRRNIPVYRYPEVKKAIADGRTIFIVEGEKCADAMWEIGLAATTNIGGAKKWRSSDTKCLEGVIDVVICPDRDLGGVNHALKIDEDFPSAKWLYAPPSEFYWLSEHLPSSQGLDVADWIEAGATKDLIVMQITSLSPGKFSSSLPLSQSPKPDELAEKNREVVIEAEEIYTQKAVDCLYSDTAYLAIHDKLYKYNGRYYELLSTPRERRRVLEWCKRTPIESRGKWIYGLAKPETVNKIWTWVLTSFAVDPEEVNPPGINCLNGVLQIKWQGKRVSYELVPHSEDFYFTHIANFEYDSTADDRDCNRLLAALDPAQQLIFLRTIAASLDLPTVRKYQGRGVKALLCQGTGSNGKDTLREAVRCILGAGMTSASVTDFQQYDQGRKFPLTKLEHSQINWSSENSQFARLDSLQGLKAAITGETIDIEPKNSMEYPITPRGVFLFNVNESPLLEGGMEAISSRWAVLAFTKTFKKNANPQRGELEADSRFRYDPDFLEQQVCPALLNKILDQLQAVVLEGIDYAPVEAALHKIQEQSNHLWQFVREVGIVESAGDRLYISDLWNSLESWYAETGTLEYEKIGDRIKKVWHDQPRASDRNVTATNQVAKRFQELYPNAQLKVHRERDNSDRRGKKYFLNLSCSGSAVDRHRIESQSHGSDGSAKSATLARLLQDMENLNEAEVLTATNLMKNFLSRQDKVSKNADPSDPAHSAKDTCRSTADPLQDDIREERSPNTNTQSIESATNTASESSFALTINNAAYHTASIPLTTSNTVANNQEKPIEWVRDKAGTSWNVDSQNGDHLVVHRPGLRGQQELDLNDCEEIHYAETLTESET